MDEKNVSIEFRGTQQAFIPSEFNLTESSWNLSIEFPGGGGDGDVNEKGGGGGSTCLFMRFMTIIVSYVKRYLRYQRASPRKDG